MVNCEEVQHSCQSAKNSRATLYNLIRSSACRTIFTLMMTTFRQFTSHVHVPLSTRKQICGFREISASLASLICPSVYSVHVICNFSHYFFWILLTAMDYYFVPGRPIRRIFFSSVLGTTAAAICYPKEAVLITQTNYHRLKTFVIEQWEKHNKRQAERAVKEELKTSVDETKTSTVEVKAETASVDDVKEGASNQKEIIEKQETQETNAEPPVVSTENTSKGSFWSKIPFVDKFMGAKPSEADEVKSVKVVESVDKTGSSKDQVIVQEKTSSDVPKPEGDTGQSNPEDKDMYSTRS